MELYMIKIENIEVYNIARAVFSARNALNSWNKSDSDLEHDILGENDLDLAKRLYKAGSEHRKYLRQIFVSMDVTAPLYWWKEFDTYKVGTVANSCSTMHTVHKKEFELSDFSHDHITGYDNAIFMGQVIQRLNINRDLYLNSKNKAYWWNIIQLLPSSYNQRRTITMNYENVVSIIKQRSGHKLTEWEDFIAELKKLPYITEIMGD